MQTEILERLIRLNQEFYQSFAASFAETRARLQPGVKNILQSVPLDAAVLDLGCGNGGVACALQQTGYRGSYFGVDASAALLTHAREQCNLPGAQFLEADLTHHAWIDQIPSPCTHAFAFAVLHHIPGRSLRERLVHEVHRVLVPGGIFALSNWNFMQSARLRARVVPWETIGLRPQDLEQGDYLLDWRRGGYGLRYVHLFREEELQALAEACGFEVTDTFFSNGEGGRLGLYQTWKKMSGVGKE